IPGQAPGNRRESSPQCAIDRRVLFFVLFRSSCCFLIPLRRRQAQTVGNALIVSPDHRMVARVVQQKCIVSVRRVNLGIGNRLSVLQQCLYQFARTLWRKAPVGGKRHGEELCCCRAQRSEEHTSELQSRENLVCRLLLEKKKSIP